LWVVNGVLNIRHAVEMNKEANTIEMAQNTNAIVMVNSIHR